MLNDQQNAQLRQVLLEAERRVLQSAQHALELTREGPTDGGRDSIDQSNSEELVSTALRLRDREQKLLNKIREALVRLDEGLVDECEMCGGPIAFRRLLVRPVTTLCIDCKERSEEDERRAAVSSEEAPSASAESAEEWSEG